MTSIRHVVQRLALGALASTAVLGAVSASGGVPSADSLPTPTITTPPAIVSFSSAGGTSAAFRELDGGERVELLVGSGAELGPAPGVAPLDANADAYADFARLHVGSDVDGRAVVVYPRCRDFGGARERCDLYRYDVSEQRSSLITGIRRPGRNEYEGVMVRGALAFFATTPGRFNDGARGLWYRPAGGALRRITPWAGSDLALRGRRIAYETSDGGKDGGEEPCSNSTLVLRSVDGGRARPIARQCAYAGGGIDRWRSPTFWGDSVYFARGSKMVFRYRLASAVTSEAKLSGGSIFDYQPTGTRQGLASVLRSGNEVADNRPWAATTIRQLSDVRWQRRQSSLVREYQWNDPDALR